MKEYPYKERLLAGIIDSMLLSFINSIYLLPALFFAILPLIAQITSQASTDPDLVDGAGFIASLVWLMMWSLIIFVINTAVGGFWHVYRPAKHNGQTYGKEWMKVKVVKIDNSELTMKSLLIRYVAQLFLAQAINIFMYITIFIDEEKRAVYDFVSNTKVVRA